MNFTRFLASQNNSWRSRGDDSGSDGFATDFSNTVTAGNGQVITLNPGDTVTVMEHNQEGIVATGTGVLKASGVTVTTQGNNGSGAAAHAGGKLQ